MELLFWDTVSDLGLLIDSWRALFSQNRQFRKNVAKFICIWFHPELKMVNCHLFSLQQSNIWIFRFHHSLSLTIYDGTLTRHDKHIILRRIFLISRNRLLDRVCSLVLDLCPTIISFSKKIYPVMLNDFYFHKDQCRAKWSENSSH